MMKVTFGRIIDNFLHDTGLVSKKNPVSQAGIIDQSRVKKLDIITGSADVNVLVHDKPFIDIILDTFENGPQLKISHDDESVRIETCGSHNMWMMGLDQLHLCLHIKVPLNLADIWNVKTGSGDIKIPKIRTDSLQVTTGSGDVELHKPKANVLKLHASSGDMKCHDIVADSFQISTTSGDVELSELKGNAISGASTSGDLRINDTYSEKLSARTISGDVDIEDVRADVVELVSTSGDIEGTSTKANKTFLKTISGDVDYDYVNDCHIQGSATSGDLMIRCKNTNPNATVDLDTRSGSIRTNMTRNIHQKSDNHLSGVVGNGEYHIQLKSTSGDIELIYR